MCCVISTSPLCSVLCICNQISLFLVPLGQCIEVFLFFFFSLDLPVFFFFDIHPQSGVGCTVPPICILPPWSSCSVSQSVCFKRASLGWFLVSYDSQPWCRQSVIGGWCLPHSIPLLNFQVITSLSRCTNTTQSVEDNTCLQGEAHQSELYTSGYQWMEEK